MAKKKKKKELPMSFKITKNIIVIALLVVYFGVYMPKLINGNSISLMVVIAINLVLMTYGAIKLASFAK